VGDRQGVRDIVCDLVGQLPGQDVAREVIEHGRQTEPVLADHPQVGKVGLPMRDESRRFTSRANVATAI
jgi:hypothetical protein